MGLPPARLCRLPTLAATSASRIGLGPYRVCTRSPARPPDSSQPGHPLRGRPASTKLSRVTAQAPDAPPFHRRPGSAGSRLCPSSTERHERRVGAVDVVIDLQWYCFLLGRDSARLRLRAPRVGSGRDCLGGLGSAPGMPPRLPARHAGSTIAGPNRDTDASPELAVSSKPGAVAVHYFSARPGSGERPYVSRPTHVVGSTSRGCSTLHDTGTSSHPIVSVCRRKSKPGRTELRPTPILQDGPATML